VSCHNGRGGPFFTRHRNAGQLMWRLVLCSATVSAFALTYSDSYCLVSAARGLQKRLRGETVTQLYAQAEATAKAQRRKHARHRGRSRQRAVGVKRRHDDTATELRDFPHEFDVDLSRQDVLDQQLFALAAQVLPRADSEMVGAKRNICQRMQVIAEKVLGNGSQAIPFGSSVNCCGEATSDIDFVIYVPPEISFEAGKSMHKVYSSCLSDGFERELLLTHSRIPLATLRDTESGCMCDVSIQDPLPVINTRLLRTYAHLEPYIMVLSMAVKRWAKYNSIGTTQTGAISSYSWTLLVIYYLQVCHGLPSAHMVFQEKLGEMRLEPPPSFECAFSDIGDCKSRYPVTDDDRSVGELLKGFFFFYAREFGWQSEVVSVRLGSRNDLKSGNCFNPTFLARAENGCGSLNIEDPIECRRNLNFALGKTRGLELIKAAIQKAHRDLQSGAVLPVSLVSKPPFGRWLDEPRKMLIERLGGYLEVSTVELPCKCEGCGKIMPLEELLEHGVRCADLATKKEHERDAVKQERKRYKERKKLRLQTTTRREVPPARR